MCDMQHLKTTSFGAAIRAAGNLPRSSLAYFPLRPIAQFAVLALATLFLSGCFYSLQPLYTDKDTLFMPELIGTWQDSESVKACEKNDTQTTLTFTKSGEQAYEVAVNTLTFTKSGDQPCVQDSKETHRFEAHMVKLDGLMMLDLYPSDAFSRLDDQLFPVHVFIKIEVRPDRLRVTNWNIEYLDKRLSRGQLKIAHVRLKDAIPGNAWMGPFDAVLLTGTAADLQKRLREIASDPETFSEKDATDYRRAEENGPMQQTDR
jgi:hypothetical protein